MEQDCPACGRQRIVTVRMRAFWWLPTLLLAPLAFTAVGQETPSTETAGPRAYAAIACGDYDENYSGFDHEDYWVDRYRWTIHDARSTNDTCASATGKTEAVAPVNGCFRMQDSGIFYGGVEPRQLQRSDHSRRWTGVPLYSGVHQG